MQSYRGYSEPDLVTNRSSLLLYGGTGGDRRAWAEEAHRSFADEGALLEVSAAGALGAALALRRGIVYIPDTVALGADAQGHILRCLQQQEERPKLVLGMPRPPAEASDAGVLRDDLLYRLQSAQVDLGQEEVLQGIRARRQKVAAAARKPSGEAARQRPGAKKRR